MIRWKPPIPAITTIRAALRKAGVRAWFLFCGVFSGVILLESASVAAGDSETTLPQGSMGMASLKMAAALFIVIGMILGLYYLSKKLRDGRFLLKRSPSMRVIGSLSLAPKRSVALVEVCGEWLVLGIGAESITLLRRFEEPPANPAEVMPPGSEGSNTFQTLLRRTIRRPATGISRAGQKDDRAG
jgi:flagellar protein FliO/FliZ